MRNLVLGKLGAELPGSWLKKQISCLICWSGDGGSEGERGERDLAILSLLMINSVEEKAKLNVEEDSRGTVTITVALCYWLQYNLS